LIIVDDRLSLDVLAGRLTLGSCATTWGFHYRLTRALSDESRHGVLSRNAGPEVRAVVANPPGERLRVLDPREVTSLAARMAVRHGLNVLGAEMIASAVHYRAELYLSAGNIGRSWPDALAAEAVSLTVV
jgi:hypothetical protein